jgi:NTE family protein
VNDLGDDSKPQPGVALCLSGGGYRAMLFHVGALLRLNELGYLPRLDRVSSVSGGSITAAKLACHWGQLQFDKDGVTSDLGRELVEPIRRLAGRTIDQGSILGGIFTPGTIADKVAGAYREHLFDRATLQDLPDRPRFVVNATNVQTGSLWRFSKPYMADYRIGLIPTPATPLATVVAASSAFPPVLSPLRLELDASAYEPPSGQPSEDLHREPFLTDVVLTDGGVYDNLGLETVWKRYQTVLVSNGGGKIQPEPEPKGDWARHALRINEVIDNQVRSLRVRQVIAGYQTNERKGTYWGIRVNLDDYGLPDALPCPVDKTILLASLKTRLKRLEPTVQERLINWGYAACDAAMRRWIDPMLPKPRGLPYPASGVG